MENITATLTADEWSDIRIALLVLAELTKQQTEHGLLGNTARSIREEAQSLYDLLWKATHDSSTKTTV